MMGDDHTDIQLIRDDWVRIKARWQASKKYPSRALRCVSINLIIYYEKELCFC